jgi:hypothetical protein
MIIGFHHPGLVAPSSVVVEASTLLSVVTAFKNDFLFLADFDGVTLLRLNIFKLNSVKTALSHRHRILQRFFSP